MDKKYFYTRKLPHWQPEEDYFFITYRLAGSLPVAVINTLKEEYKTQKKLPENQLQERKEMLREYYFESFENELEKNLNEPHWLKNDPVAEIVFNSLLFNNNKHYRLWAACLMSNHVHILLQTMTGSPPLNVILQNHKKFTAVHCNKILHRTGQFWAEESFDTLLRNNVHFYSVVNYIIQNPVKAGLIKRWKDWKWTYLHPELDKEYRRNKSIG
jgi:putative transposase